jgi:hypothetical protein
MQALEDEIEAELPIATQIQRFLDGESDGRALFEMLYGEIGDEPVPEHLLALVREKC